MKTNTLLTLFLPALAASLPVLNTQGNMPSKILLFYRKVNETSVLSNICSA